MAYLGGGAFAVVSLLMVIVDRTLWFTKWYWEYLSILGISSGVLAALALKNSGYKLWAVASVAAGLLIGQWWFVESMAACKSFGLYEDSRPSRRKIKA